MILIAKVEPRDVLPLFAACKGMDMSISSKGGWAVRKQKEELLAVCAECPVLDKCKDYARRFRWHSVVVAGWAAPSFERTSNWKETGFPPWSTRADIEAFSELQKSLFDTSGLRLDLIDKEPPPQRLCSIPGCGKPYLALGYCGMHRKRFKLYGDPHYTRNEIDPDK